MFGKRREKETRQKFEKACLEHLDPLYASALKLTRSAHDAEELVQDTYLKAFRFADKFEWGTNLKAWLFRIQTNAFINEYRHKRHQRRYLERAATEPIYDEVFNKEARAYSSNPEAHAFTRFFKEDLDRALEELPDDFRTVVVLSDLNGFSYKEIAEIVECPVGTVMSRLHRGRRLLQRELVDHAVEAGIRVAKKADKEDAALTDITNYRRRKEGLS
ncbi:MAG: sigma-70 family RNA polymerase sigma factor [Deltaproteobacteria bacterium]|nr:sigma-70 family RNA polymerase sigma factor [Deltaproteobacteria bacterium]